METIERTKHVVIDWPTNGSNRPSLYAVFLTHKSGRRVLVGFAGSKSGTMLRRVVCKWGNEVVGLVGGENFQMKDAKTMVLANGWSASFSGETKRDLHGSTVERLVDLEATNG